MFTGVPYLEGKWVVDVFFAKYKPRPNICEREENLCGDIFSGLGGKQGNDRLEASS